jgi:hypothetical protein
MYILGFFSFILILINLNLTLTYGDSNHDYFQVLEEFSFNLKNKFSSDVDKLNLINNFILKGEGIITNDQILFTAGNKNNNSKGLIHTKGDILSPSIELHLNFEFNTYEGGKQNGTAFAIWFFKDENRNINTTDNEEFDFIGFKVIYKIKKYFK